MPFSVSPLGCISHTLWIRKCRPYTGTIGRRGTDDHPRNALEAGFLSTK